MAAVMERFLRHGGRLAAARAAWPAAPQPWLDLSTGINPVPWDGARASPDDLRRLPDPDAVAALETCAARAFGAEPSCVAVTPGAEAGLRLLPGITGATSVAIVAPTYGGHAEAWANAGAAVTADRVRAQALVVVNPNNPDGARTPSPGLIGLAEDRWVIVDESFVETAPELSVADKAGGRLIVLRSFGKFYGLAGVRLGFVVAAPDLAARVRQAFGDWPISAEALAAGAAYADEAWRTETLARLTADAARLDGLLEAAGFRIVGGTPLFRLTASEDAEARFEALARAGVLTRPFADRPQWLRFGLPGPKHWGRLEAALKGLSS